MGNKERSPSIITRMLDEQGCVTSEKESRVEVSRDWALIRGGEALSSYIYKEPYCPDLDTKEREREEDLRGLRELD